MKTFKASSSPSNIALPSGLLFLLLFFTQTVSCGTIVKSLPGFDGELPFTLETGYVGVQDGEVQLFYYFVESQTTPSEDPLMLWIPGGPGCSGLTALFFENGPLTMDVYNYTGVGLPTLLSNPYTWTEKMSIIFLDGPVGTGFSYATNSEATYTGDYKFLANTYEFLQKWFNVHPQYLENPLYIAGDGYSGVPVPLLVNRILEANIAGETTMNIKGYVLGNPGTDNTIDFNARRTVAYRLALVPDRLYRSAYINCDNGNFETTHPSDQCHSDLEEMDELVANVNPTNILQPACGSGTPGTSQDLTRRSLTEKSENLMITCSVSNVTNKECAAYTQGVCENWANNEDVRKALNVTEGTVTCWQYCNNDLNPLYTHDVDSVVNYHQNFTKTDLQALIYSGDHDTGVPYIGTEEWIWSLNLTLVDRWRAWTVENETAGYTRRFTNIGDYNLTFATLKGAGHYAATDKMEWCSVMVNKWKDDISL